jgi:chromosome segregation ATPase
VSALADTLARRATDQVGTIAGLRREVDGLRAELSAAVDANATASIERDGLGRALARRSYELAALRAELDALQSSLSEALVRLSGAEAVGLAVREQLEHAHRENDQLRAELRQARAEIEDREHELADAEQLSAERATEQAGATRALRWRLAAAEHERAAVERQRDAAERRFVAQIEGLEAQTRLLSGERDRSAEAVQDRDRSIEALHDQLKQETAIAESLTAQLDRVERRLAVRATQLQAIRQSRSFRIALRLANFKDAVVHPRSRRRRRESQAAGEIEAE